jgi:hypothetical protein
MSLGATWHRTVDRWASMSTKDRRALTIGAMILIPALAWKFVVIGYMEQIESLQDQLASEQALLQREKEVLRQAPTMPAEIEAARRSLAQWDERFVRSPNPALAEAEVTSVLEDVAKSSRVLLQEVRTLALPRGEATPEGLLPIRLSVEGESDFEGVLRFLQGMEQNPVLLRIVGLSVDPVQIGSAANNAAAAAPGRAGAVPPPPAPGRAGNAGNANNQAGNQNTGRVVGGRLTGPQPGAMTFVVIVEAYASDEAPPAAGG